MNEVDVIIKKLDKIVGDIDDIAYDLLQIEKTRDQKGAQSLISLNSKLSEIVVSLKREKLASDFRANNLGFNYLSSELQYRELVTNNIALMATGDIERIIENLSNYIHGIHPPSLIALARAEIDRLQSEFNITKAST